MRKLEIIEHPPRSFELFSTKAFPSGIIFGAYKVAGQHLPATEAPWLR